jgi:TonB family protein
MGGESGDDPYVGHIFAQRYRIHSKIGEGAQARVYVGRHLIIKRQVAIKVLLPALGADRTLVDRFLNEGRAAGTLGHPNIVESLDMGRAQDGAPFLVMELLQGKTLAEDIGHPFLVGRAAYIASQVAGAVAAANARGIVHRDLKPENVFLIERGGKPDHVKVLDFGISKFHQGKLRVTTLKGQVLGTPDYMAPEQIESPEDVDARVDVYALGAMLYAMLAGEAPFALVEFPKVLRVICEGPARPITELRPELPARMVEIIERAMSMDRALRFQSMTEFEEALEPFVLEPRKSSPRSSSQVSPAKEPAASAPAASAAPPAEPVQAVPPEEARALQIPPLPARTMPLPDAGPRHRPLKAVVGILIAGAALTAWLLARPHGGSGAATAPVQTPTSSPSSVPVAAQAEVPTSPEPSRTPTPERSQAPPTAQHTRTVPTWLSHQQRTPAATVREPSTAQLPSPASSAPLVATPSSPIATSAPPPPPPPVPVVATAAVTAAPPPPAPAITGAAPGTIETRAVNATVHAHAGEVRTCFDRAKMNNDDLRGRVAVRASVAPDGNVTAASVASTTVNDSRLESCIVNAFRSWQFPPPAGGIAGSVAYTFVFE